MLPLCDRRNWFFREVRNLLAAFSSFYRGIPFLQSILFYAIAYGAALYIRFDYTFDCVVRICLDDLLIDNDSKDDFVLPRSSDQVRSVV